MKKTVSTVLAVAALVAGALTLTAFRHHPDPARLDRILTHRLDDLLDDVHATDSQRQQVIALKDDLLAQGKAIRAGQADARKELLAQWKSDHPDATRVRALVDGRAEAMKAFAGRVSDAVLRLHDILTPDQRAIVTRKLERHMEE